MNVQWNRIDFELLVSIKFKALSFRKVIQVEDVIRQLILINISNKSTMKWRTITWFGIKIKSQTPLKLK